MYSNKYDRITGLWSRKSYILLKRLGSGGIGEIYLVRNEEGGLLALKLSTDLVSITKEYGHLKRFSDKSFVPKVYELDDFKSGQKVYHYFTMEYIEGYTLRRAVENGGMSLKCKLELVYLLLKLLQEINKAGYVYSDLKHENIMIDKRNGQIRLVDFGSLVEMGSTVKEYTPMYDRACWHKGKRIAEVSYQLFTVMVLLITLVLGKNIDPDKDSLTEVCKRLRKRGFAPELCRIMLHCLDGTVYDAEVLCKEIAAACEGIKNRDKLNAVLNGMIVFLSILLAGTIYICF